MFRAVSNIRCTRSVMRRQLHSCPVMCDAVKKQAKIMAKLITGSHRKKRNWYFPETISPALSVNKSFQEGPQGKRRVDVLNKLFMRHITDLIATEDVASELAGRGISITKVKVCSDFTAVNVYWIAPGYVHDAELEMILENTGFKLRHELSQLHVIGKVPKICFVADKWQIIYEKTSQCLERAKDIDRHVVEDPPEEMRSEYALGGPTKQEIMAKSNELKVNFDQDPLPPMTHDVLGVDHSAIMNKIQAAVTKSEARHRHNTDSFITYSEHSTEKTSVKKDYGIHPSVISKYIAKQKIQKRKIEQARNKVLLELEVPDQPLKEEYMDLEDGDFIDEFEEKMNNSSEHGEK